MIKEIKIKEVEKMEEKVPTQENLALEKEESFKKLEELIHLVVDKTRIEMVPVDESFQLTIPLPGDRKQKVHINLERRDFDGEDIIQIFTTCVEADSTLYEFALRMNAELDYGALAVKDIGEKPFLVIIDTHLLRTADADGIEKSVITLAQVGDDIEELLTGEDVQ